MRKIRLIYSIFFFVICLVPFVGMFVTKDKTSAENRELAEFPSVQTEEGWNIHWLSEAGDYFQEHFAFRQKMVTANAIINGKVFGVSSVEGVIQGKNNWLYYKDSLNDYQGKNLLSNRSLFNIAHSMSITQRTLEKKGISFAFAVAPNKNSLYGDNMPYYMQCKVSEESNLKNLQKYLDLENVSYVNLLETLAVQEEILYHERDSHWNNKGAALAGDAILEVLTQEHCDYSNETFQIRKDFEGDLDKMLYPEAITLEDEIYYDRKPSFSYVENVINNFEPRIKTVNPAAQGNLVMYRDSFGNALLPFMADAYANAYFSRGVPYQISADIDANLADSVVIVRAERFLPEMAAAVPVLQVEPEAEVSGTIERITSKGTELVQVKSLGPLVQISGRILSKYLDETSLIYIRFGNGTYYEAFPQDIEIENVTDSGGFCLYIAEDQLISGMEKFDILTGKDGAYQVVGEGVIPSELIHFPEAIIPSDTENTSYQIEDEIVG